MRSSIVNVDWLSFSVSLALSEDERREGAVLRTPAGFSLVELGGTNIYKRRYYVLNAQGEKCLTLLLEPHSKVIDSADMFVEVANKWLYYPLSWVFPLVCQIHECTWKSLSRLDICCDFCPDLRQVGVIEQLTENQLYVGGKRMVSAWFDYSMPTEGGQVTRRCYDMNWGRQGSNLKWKLYWKSKEVTEVEVRDGREVKWCNKPYIQEQWRNAGWDVDNVWRLEVSISSANKYRWRGERIDLERLMKDGYVQELFEDLYETRFVIRANQGHKCRKWDERVPLLVFDNPEVYRLREREYESTREYHEYVAQLRAAMKQLDDVCVKGYDRMREVWVQAAEATLDAGRLRPYFYRTYGKEWEAWLEEYRKS